MSRSSLEHGPQKLDGFCAVNMPQFIEAGPYLAAPMKSVERQDGALEERLPIRHHNPMGAAQIGVAAMPRGL
jgi:hypothetical protein